MLLIFFLDHFEFHVPSLESSPVYQRRYRSNTDIKDLDLSLYKTSITKQSSQPNIEEAVIIEECTKKTIGKLNCDILYDKVLQKLSVTCKDIKLHYRPFSKCNLPVNYDNEWDVDEFVTIEIIKTGHHSTHGRKISLFHSKSNPLSTDIKKYDKSELSIKSKNPQNYTMKFSVYHGKMKEKNQALGLVFVPMVEVLSYQGSVYNIEKIITNHDEVCRVAYICSNVYLQHFV